MEKTCRSKLRISRAVVLFFLLKLPLLFTGHLSALNPQHSLFQYVVSSWTKETGLPSNSVVALAQSTDGYLYIAAPQGLSRFDGVKFSAVNIFDGQQPGYFEITCLQADREGYLWIGTKGRGLWRLKGRRYKQFTLKHGLSDLSVDCVYKDYQGNVWIGTSDGKLNCLKEDTTIVYGDSAGLPGSPLYAIFEDSRGILWLGMKREGLYRFSNGSGEKIPLRGLDILDIHSVCEDLEGRLWLGSDRGLICLRNLDGEYDLGDESVGLSHRMVYEVFLDGDGNIWAGTADGLNRVKMNGTGWQIDRTMDKAWIKAVFEDQEKNLWIGTDGRGLQQMREGKIRTFSRDEGLPYDYIVSLYEDNRGHLWVGSTRGLIRFNQGALKPTAMSIRYTGSIVGSICEDADGSIWFGTFGSGLFRIRPDGSTVNYTRRDGLLSDSIIALLVDRRGNLWIGTDNGLNCRRQGEFISYTRDQGVSRDIIYYLYEDLNNNIWLIYDQGVDLFRGEPPGTVKPEKLPPEVVVADIYEDPENIIWIATKGSGLFKLDGGGFRQYTVADGLPSNFLHQIMADSEDYLWFTSKVGIFKVARGDLLDLAEGRISQLNTFPYGEKEGVKTEEITMWSLYSAVKTGDNRLLIGNKNGISVIDLEHFKINKVPPPVIIEKVIVNRNILLDLQAANVLEGVKEINFYFTAPHFISPERVAFKYKLEGYDRNWIFPEIGSRRQASYADLPAGDYSFVVKARNSQGVWNNTGALLAFRVKLRWLQTPLFKILLILLGLLGAAGIYRLLARTSLFKKEKYKGSTLDPARAESYVKKLTQLLEVDRVYRDESLSLKSLAEMLSVTTYHLSQVINEKLNKNFFDLINGYRVEEAKEKLSDFKEEQTILGIGFEVGFNSKSAFNRVFKKFTQMTPSEFRKKHRQENPR